VDLLTVFLENLMISFDVKIIMKLSKIKLMKNFKVLKKTCFNAETDDPITIKEIQIVLNKLKNSKAGGPDGIINELIKYSCNITLKSVETKLCFSIFISH
jgi:hypothetical protein